ncbi:type VII secretion protein EccE [Mycolicibacterium aubagnense]|uniref:Type VII secretion system protein EccE domain-containing protein n=1 Tax=Mycolicibacterium aubagnense TaxID=319707 RepID=A0ABM7IM58_9MYCO|nr:type VII secretion protein EccE [Mycolicibacterium aubagnense]BBX87899.1 hypothetical protein MAUB_57720 [Mycolicibacterium aubagnense]
MARRKRDEAAATAGSEASAPRTASPGRELVSLDPRTSMAASMLATSVAFGGAGLGLPPAAWAGSAAAVVAAFGARVGGRTLGQWVSLRRGANTLPDQAALFSRDGVGVVFDGTTVSACVKITPRPWQLTTVNATGSSETPVISADQLRRQLRQYDIGLSRLDVICAGYKFAVRDHAASTLDTLIGPVSVPLGGTTVIVVSLDLQADILGPAYRRARRDSLPDGVCQTLTIAATRVCYALAEQGFGGTLMGAPEVREFHDAVLTQVARPMCAPGWRHCGDTAGVHTRTYVPGRGHWNAESAGGWNHLQAHRQYTTLTLTPQGDDRALAQPLITYVVRGGDALAKAAGYGLRPAVGQQVAGINQALPVSSRAVLRSSGAVIDDHHRLGFGIPAGGAGIFIGTAVDKTRVFVAVSPALEPLWISGPKLFAMQLVARLSTQDKPIAVMIDDPAWHQLIAHRNTPALTSGTIESSPAEIVVCTPPWWEQHRELCAGKAVLLVTEDAPGRGATNSLAIVKAPGGSAEIEVSVDAQSTRVLWELTPIERRALLGDAQTDGSATPREGSALRLGAVVQLPASRSAAPKRKAAAQAPVVPTVPQADPWTAPVLVQTAPLIPPPGRDAGRESADRSKGAVVQPPARPDQPPNTEQPRSSRTPRPVTAPVRTRRAAPLSVPVQQEGVPGFVTPPQPAPRRAGRHHRPEDTPNR